MCFSEWRSDVCSADLRQGIETAVLREHQQLVGRFRMQGEAMAVAFLILDVAELGAVPLDRADPALGRAEDGNRFPPDHGFERDDDGRRRIAERRTALAERGLRSEALAQRTDLVRDYGPAPRQIGRAHV